MHVRAYISNPHNIHKAWKGPQYHNSFFNFSCKWPWNFGALADVKKNGPGTVRDKSSPIGVNKINKNRK